MDVLGLILHILGVFCRLVQLLDRLLRRENELQQILRLDNGVRTLVLRSFVIKHNLAHLRSEQQSHRLSKRFIVPEELLLLSLRRVKQLDSMLQYTQGEVRAFDATRDLPVMRSIWQTLIGGDDFSLKNRKWKQIGFQRDEPLSDLRGMGVLSLHNISYVCQSNESMALELCELANRDELDWFPFAVTCINLTADLLHQLDDSTGSARVQRIAFLFNLLRFPMEEAFGDSFVSLLAELQREWRKQAPVNVMAFASIHQTALRNWKKRLLRQVDLIAAVHLDNKLL
ncbi:MAG: hypothetical protein MHM6MM_000276 [Cercozoa sp. M6MM]